MQRKSAMVYICGILLLLVMVLVAALTFLLYAEAENGPKEKPRFDLPDDVPWDKIPWQTFPDNFPYDEVPWEDLPEDTEWGEVEWEKVPWDKLPDNLVDVLPLEDIPWDALPEDMPWEDLPLTLPWDEIDWKAVPWAELPDNFPYASVPWEDMPDDFNWKAVTCSHQFQVSTELAATCVMPGVDLYYCPLCDFSMRQPTQPTGQHVFEGEWIDVVPADCVHTGTQHRLCTTCGIAEETQTTQPNGIHQYEGEWIEDYPADCENAGQEYRICINCHEQRETQPISPLGHKYDGEWIEDYPADCENAGQEYRICINCHVQRETQEIAATGHKFEDDWQVVSPADCENGMVEHRFCVNCHQKEEVRQGQPLGHRYAEDWTVAIPADCVNAGTLHRYCTTCGKGEETRPISPEGHSFDGNGVCGKCDFRKITLSSDSASKQYDGTPLSVQSCRVTAGLLAAGHKIVGTYVTLDKVGIAANVFTAKIVDASGADVSDKYEITYLYGALALYKRQITVTTPTLEKQFDGSALFCNAVECQGLAEGDSVQIVAKSQLSERGTCSNVVEIKILNKDGQDVTENYSITYVYGRLTVS